MAPKGAPVRSNQVWASIEKRAVFLVDLPESGFGHVLPFLAGCQHCPAVWKHANGHNLKQTYRKRAIIAGCLKVRVGCLEVPGNKLWDQNCQFKVGFWPFIPKRALITTPHYHPKYEVWRIKIFCDFFNDLRCKLSTQGYSSSYFKVDRLHICISTKGLDK